MRFLLPVAAAAAALTVGVAPAAAPSKSHAAPHPSGSSPTSPCTSPSHSVLGGDGVVVHGKVRPERRATGSRSSSAAPARGVPRTATQANGAFAPALDARADRQLRGPRLRRPRPPRRAARRARPRRLTAYRQAGASYYGPGLYGNGVACGGTLMPGTLGVANKTLPCGTKVKLRYHGRSVTVPVIDRGPYVAGRDFDLTEATKERLGFPGVGDGARQPLASAGGRAAAGGCRLRSLRLGVRLAFSKEATRTPSRRTGRGGS